MEAVERTIDLPGPPARVWASITDGLSEWFGADVELEGRPHGRASFRWADGRERGAVVEEFRVPRRLAFRWLPFERTAAGEIRLVPSTRVELEIEETGGGVRLRVTELPVGAGAFSAGSEWVRAWAR